MGFLNAHYNKGSVALLWQPPKCENQSVKINYLLKFEHASKVSGLFNFMNIWKSHFREKTKSQNYTTHCQSKAMLPKCTPNE